ncbi:MAG: hypothetical protein ACOC2L_03300, partial [Candidatus Sumerlaeota bacterium]
SPYEAACAFCAKLATETPRARGELYYGGNNWYYAYGDITHASCVADAERIAEWSPDGAEKPYMVIDDGWQVAHCDNRYNSGPWHTGNVRFPDMPRLAAEMADRGIRPGIWYRPLVNLEGHMEPFMIRNGNLPSYSKGGYAMDPTFPEVRQRLEDDAVRLSDWGFQMIKHDFTTVDLLGTWCGTSGPMATPSSGWHFNDRSLTNAEIVKDLYRRIMQAAGETRIIGCQTLGHLGVGSIDLQRAGGDVSGRDWERTRRMGPNSLAFRMPQHDRFFQVDADCAPVTPKVPWKFAKQWLDLLARSGTPLFISANPESVNDETLPFIKDMLAVAASHPSPAEPLDWMDTPTPRIWKTSDGEKTYNWLPEIGCAPAGLVPGDPTCILKGNT